MENCIMKNKRPRTTDKKVISFKKDGHCAKDQGPKSKDENVNLQSPFRNRHRDNVALEVMYALNREIKRL